jgi:hypothetical protein
MSNSKENLLMAMQDVFHGFVVAGTALEKHDVEHVQPGIDEEGVVQLEDRLGVPLPSSYKEFLRRARGFWLLGGTVQFDVQHPFFHTFSKLEELNQQQRNVVEQKGDVWPPPSDGMLCFAEYFRDADGDQVLFDVSEGLVEGEYPVMYYSHETRPPFVERVAGSFREWFNTQCVQQVMPEE